MPTGYETSEPAERIVLLTAESAGNVAALEGFIEANAQRLRLVVVSDIGGGVAGVLQEALAIYKRSGVGFLPYLYGSWIHYYLAVRIRHLVAKTGLPVRRRLPLPALCRKYGIACIREAEVNSSEVIERIAEEDPDFLVSFVFDQILHDELIAVAGRGVVNVHAAVLPECRGPFPVLFSALGGDANTGVTIHEIVDSGVDSGPMLHRERVRMPERASIVYREHLLHSAAVRPLTAILDDPSGYRAGATAQEGGGYFSYPSREDIKMAKQQGTRLISAADLGRVSRESFADAIEVLDQTANSSPRATPVVACPPSVSPL
jgi:methionyl-tRNA formyltransferase